MVGKEGRNPRNTESLDWRPLGPPRVLGLSTPSPTWCRKPDPAPSCVFPGENYGDGEGERIVSRGSPFYMGATGRLRWFWRPYIVLWRASLQILRLGGMAHKTIDLCVPYPLLLLCWFFQHHSCVLNLVFCPAWPCSIPSTLLFGKWKYVQRIMACRVKILLNVAQRDYLPPLKH